MFPALGYVVGLALVWLVAEGIQRAWPQFLIVVDGPAAVQAALGALIMSFLAVLLPARFIAGLDPVRVFRR